MVEKVYRIFNGKKYKYSDTRTSKRSAEDYADNWREDNFNVRIIKSGKKYHIYVRRRH